MVARRKRACVSHMAKKIKRTIQVGPIEATQGSDTLTRMAILLWGPSTCGKSTWSATAPGTKLWLSFGDEEHKSVMHRDDVLVANLASLGIEELFKHAQSDNPFGLDKILAENEDIATVVCDSATAITYRALQKAVLDKVGASRKENFVPTMEQPGRSAYGGRNAIVLETLQGLLRITAKHNVHLIVTAHEDDPTTTKDGQGNDIIDYIGIMLGGKIMNNMTWRFSEIWYMSQKTTGGKERQIAVRPTRQRRPIKTRMFSNLGEPEFILKYDADASDKGQMTIASLYDEWVDNGYRKIVVPGSKL